MDNGSNMLDDGVTTDVLEVRVVKKATWNHDGSRRMINQHGDPCGKGTNGATHGSRWQHGQPWPTNLEGYRYQQLELTLTRSTSIFQHGEQWTTSTDRIDHEWGYNQQAMGSNDEQQREKTWWLRRVAFQLR